MSVGLTRVGLRRVGLTGGIASGKSTAAAFLQTCGLTLVDTDAIARQISGPGGSALPALQAAFGARLVDAQSGLDRAALRELVFAHPELRRQLEALLHPLIQQEAERQAAQANSCVIFDVPLLVESRHWRARVHRVLVIDCDESVQRRRLLTRPGWTPPQADGVLAAQTDRRSRRAAADAVIDNSQLGLAQFQAELQALVTLWCLHPVEESRPALP